MRRDARRILVSFSSGLKIKSRPIESIILLLENWPKFFPVNVFAYISEEYYRRLVENLAKAQGITAIQAILPCFTGIVARADISLGAAVHTIWERACLLLPTIFDLQAENQEEMTNGLSRTGHLILSSINAPHKEISFTTDRLEEMSEASYGLTDGRGIRKVAAHIMNEY